MADYRDPWDIPPMPMPAPAADPPPALRPKSRGAFVAGNLFGGLLPPAIYFVAQVIVLVIIQVAVYIASTVLSGTYSAFWDGVEESIVMLSMGVSALLCSILFYAAYRSLRKTQPPPLSFSEFGFVNVFLSFVAIMVLWYLIVTVLSFFPTDIGGYDEVVQSLESGSTWQRFLIIGLLAPLVEELCFRGLTLNRFLRVMPPVGAIFIQAALFGLIHLNAVQGSYAFLLGLFLGWLTYRSRAVWPSVLCHVFFNAGNIALSLYAETLPAEVTQTTESGGDRLVMLIIPCCILILIPLFRLNRTLPKSESRLRLPLA